ncbi:MAG: methylmalonyl-CoA mutase family protein, partial [Verrucomicrobiota bacterium]
NILLDIATLRGLNPDAAQVGQVAGCGLSLASLKDIQKAFKGIMPEAVRFHFRAGLAGIAVGGLFFTWLNYQGVDKTKVKGSLGMDPFAVLAASGKLPCALSHLLHEQAVLAKYCLQDAPGMQSVGVSVMPYHQAGASSVQELGAGLATGAAYLHALIERGVEVDDAAKQIRFSFSIGSNFFMEIAKLRAARLLWARIVESFGGSSEAQKITMHARTGLYNKTQKDPYVNMLRTTTESLSAVIAGIDSLCVGNFDETIRSPGDFSRRISRNTQVILQEECELTQVVDPAGGSWTVEWLTNQVAEKSWSFFQEIERKGGIEAALKSEFLHKEIATTAEANEKLLNQRRTSLVGTNVYPNLEEQSLDATLPDYREIRNKRIEEVSLDRAHLLDDTLRLIDNALNRIYKLGTESLFPSIMEAYRLGATLGEISEVIRPNMDYSESIRPLPAVRLASKYEAMRNASDAFTKANGEAPTIFLCNLGPLRRHKIRADFTKGFFEAGGFKIISPQGFETPEAAVEALEASHAGIVVVCGTDDDYTELFGVYAKALKAAFPQIMIVLAGYPGENEEKFRAEGMDDYIFIKSNNYEVNRRYLEGLDVF